MRIHYHLISGLVIIGMVIFSHHSHADIDREREWHIAEKLSSELNFGEAIWLGKGNKKFIGLLYDTYPQQLQDAVIIIHGMGAHPDWPDVIEPLRENLPTLGLATFSLQMPVLHPQANVAEYGRTLNEAGQRIGMAVEYLKTYGYQRVILIGYRFGALSAAHYLAHDKAHDVHAFIGISLLARKFLRPKITSEDLIRRIQIPVLDIYAEHDDKKILKTSDDRRLSANISGNNDYQQNIVYGADHDYIGQEQQLVEQIYQWIVFLDDE